MKRAARLFSSGFLSAGILVVASSAWACDEQPTAQGACCKSSGAAVAAAAAPAAAPAPAAPVAASPASADPAQSASQAEPGMRIHLDPETGTIGGPGPLPQLTEEEAVLLEPEVQEEPVQTVLPDGSVMVDLKGRGQEYFILQLDANGQRVVRCVQDPKTALQPAPSVKPEER